jgi:hypothetical protein
MRRPILVSLAALGATACASTHPSAAMGPNLTPIVGSPAPPRGKLYADCVGQAAATGKIDRTDESSTHLLRFTCTGEPARALFAELEEWSAANKSEWNASGRTWRSTAKIHRDLFGVDYCSSDGAADFACAITLNVGSFLAG